MTQSEGFRPRDFVDAVALAVEYLVDPEVREGEIPLRWFLDGLLLPGLFEQIPEPVRDHGWPPFNLVASATHGNQSPEIWSPIELAGTLEPGRYYHRARLLTSVKMSGERSRKVTMPVRIWAHNDG